MKRVPQEHDILWFSDGSVVLATDTLLFRVHKTVLSLHSTVFKDMFDLPFAGSVGGDGTSSTGGNLDSGALRPDVYEGLPMVQLLGDKGEDVAHLLRAMYEPGYYDRDDDNTPLDKITAFLVLSGKYDVAKLRADVIKQLSRKYPTTLKEYELEEENEMLFGRPRDECHFPLLKAASATSETDILPIRLMLFYACSTLPLVHTINNEWDTLARPTLQTVINGKQRIEGGITDVHNFLIETHNNALTESCPDEVEGTQNTCRPSEKFPRAELFTIMTPFLKLSDVEGSKMVNLYFERMCKSCRDSIIETINDGRSQMWSMMSSVFAMDTAMD